MILYYCSCN